MSFFSNKYFWLGIFSLFLLVGIPLTVYFVKQQQNLQTKAKPTSVIAFEPATQQAVLNQNFNIDIFLTPNENAVTFVKFKLLFDSTKIQVVTLTPNTQAFPLVLENPKIGTGSATLTLGIGAQPLAAIQAKTRVATVTVKPIALTAGTPTRLSFDPSDTQILSLAAADEPAENVLSQSTPLDITIASTGTGTPTPTSTSSATPTGTSGNQLPTCSALTISPSTTGAAPFAASLSATGTDTDGLITNATFNFGDGQTQTVSEQDNTLETVTANVSHTYQSAGSFSVSATFTDDEGGLSASCTQTLTVTATGTGTPTPTITPTPTPTPTPSPTPTPTPTLAPTGSVQTSIGILGGVLLAIIGGILLFAL